MKLKTTKWALLSGLMICAAAATAVQASSTLITFSVDMSTNLSTGSFNPPPPAGTGTDAVYVFGTFNGWSGPGLNLVQAGTTHIYTNSYTDTNDANGHIMDYRFNINGNNEGTANYDNRAAYLPTNSGASLILPTSFYGDVGTGVSPTITFQLDMSEEIELGNFHPSQGDTVDVRGSFNGWSYNSAYVLTNNPRILVTNYNFAGGLVESNVYTLTVPITAFSSGSGLPATNSEQDFKYVEDPAGAWENPGSTTANDAGNRFFVNNTNKVLPIVSYSDLPYSPLANVSFSVDMSGIVGYDTNFVPNTVSVWGTFNGWATGIPLTNNPAAANTNLYKCVVSMGEGSSIIYQFRYTNSFINGWVYDYAQDGGPNTANNNNYRRTITLPITSTILNTNYPTIFFNDLTLGDFLTVATPVLFSVDMNGAVGTDGHVFVPGVDGVYINGMFAGATPSVPNNGDPQSWYTFSGGVNPIPAPAGFQMIQKGATTVYTNLIVLPAGTPVALSYQYGMDPSSGNGGPLEDECSAGLVHYRAVRSTKSLPYVLPTDIFTNQPYVEPFFSTGNIGANGSLAGGNLKVGGNVSGKVPVSWLGRPGAHLQMKTNLTSGSWQDLLATDGTNWTSGVSSTNGFVSVTNYSVGNGKAFFRLYKP